MNPDHFWNLLAKKLSGEASAAEAAELERLLKAHPELHFPAQQIADLWKLKTRGKTLEAEAAFKNHWQELQAGKSPLHSTEAIAPPRRRYWLPVLTAAVLVGLSAWFLSTKSSTGNGKPLSQKAAITTPRGNRTKLVLPDSSIVWLNAGSELSYEPDFGRTSRQTTLAGEAFFDVRKSSVPFIVKAAGVQLKVLGTAFNVKAYPNDPTTETSLVRGRVEVLLDRRPGEPIFLNPNEKLVVTNRPSEKKTDPKAPPIVVLKTLTHVNDSLVAETSWVENKLVFADETLDEVARKMERWYGADITVADENLAALRVGGGPFENETIEQALSALQIAFDFKFSINGNHIVITR